MFALPLLAVAGLAFLFLRHQHSASSDLLDGGVVLKSWPGNEAVSGMLRAGSIAEVVSNTDDVINVQVANVDGDIATGTVLTASGAQAAAFKGRRIILHRANVRNLLN